MEAFKGGVVGWFMENEYVCALSWQLQGGGEGSRDRSLCYIVIVVSRNGLFIIKVLI